MRGPRAGAGLRRRPDAAVPGVPAAAAAAAIRQANARAPAEVRGGPLEVGAAHAGAAAAGPVAKAAADPPTPETLIRNQVEWYQRVGLTLRRIVESRILRQTFRKTDHVD
jgi:hypothetical protein